MVCNGAFYGCKSLAAVELPEGIEEIGVDAFRASGLKDITTPKSVRIIHQGAFSMCENLQTVTLNEGLMVLGTDEHFDNEMYNGVFEQSALKHVDLPQTLKKIAYNAFRNCTDLKNILLPERLEQIGRECFSGSGLKKLVLPLSVREVCAGAFKNCK